MKPDAIVAVLSAGMLGGSGCAGQQGEPKHEHIGERAFEARTVAVEGSTLAFADVDGDGAMDLLSAGRRLAVRLGDGAGGLAAAGHALAGEQPDELALADLDGDGDLDVVIANHDVHYVTVLLGDGQGGFAPAEHSPVAVAVDPHPHAVALADIDGDGRRDLLVDHSPRGRRAEGMRPEGGGVLVRRGLGGGRFDEPGTIVEAGGTPYRGFEVGDIDSDGRADLVAPLDGSVGVLLNTGEPGRVAFERGQPVAANTPFAVRLADLSGDGHFDVVCASGEGSAAVEVFLGDGRGGFEPAPGSPFRVGRGGKAIEIGDFDGDGVQDAVVAAYGSAEVLVVLGGADGLRTARIAGGCEHPWGLAAGELNGDGADDLLIVGDGEREGRLLLSRPR